MCRNIKKLRQAGRRVPPHHELEDAALQFVRKISGYRKPSKANQVAFDRAVQQITEAGRELFRSLHIEHRHRAA